MTKASEPVGQEKSAARRLAETFSAETLDALIKDAVKSGTPIDGADGLLNELTKAVLERAMTAASTSTSTPTDIRCSIQRRALLPQA